MKSTYLSEFVTFVQSGSLVSAAAQLGIPQSSLSRHISDIEKEVGFELFTRSEKYHLTPAGLIFYNCAIKTVHSLKMAIDECQAVKTNKHLALSIHEIPIRINCFYNHFCDLMLELGQQHPDIDIENRMITSTDALFALEQKACDVVQMQVLKNSASKNRLLTNENIEAYLIAEDVLSVWIDRSDVQANKTSLTVPDMARIPFFTTISSLAASFEDVTKDLFAHSGLNPLFRYVEAETFTDFLLECNAGGAAFILPASASTDSRVRECSQSRVVLPIDDSHAIEEYYLVIRKNNTYPGVEAFRKIISSHFRDVCREAR